MWMLNYQCKCLCICHSKEFTMGKPPPCGNNQRWKDFKRGKLFLICPSSKELRGTHDSPLPSHLPLQALCVKCHTEGVTGSRLPCELHVTWRRHGGVGALGGGRCPKWRTGDMRDVYKLLYVHSDYSSPYILLQPKITQFSKLALSPIIWPLKSSEYPSVGNDTSKEKNVISFFKIQNWKSLWKSRSTVYTPYCIRY